MKILGPLDLKEAVAILSHFGHRGCTWRSHDIYVCPSDCDPRIRVEPSEAVAIAEKYLRDHTISFSLLNSESTQEESGITTSTILHIKLSSSSLSGPRIFSTDPTNLET